MKVEELKSEWEFAERNAKTLSFSYKYMAKLLAVVQAAKSTLDRQRDYQARWAMQEIQTALLDLLCEESNPIAPIDKDFQVLAKEIDVLKYRIKQLREESDYIFGLKIEERLNRLELIHPVPKTWTKGSLEGKEPPI